MDSDENLQAWARKNGISPKDDAAVKRELDISREMRESLPEPDKERLASLLSSHNLYKDDDAALLNGYGHPNPDHTSAIKSIDDLLKRDAQREKDGFPKKARFGKIAKPEKSGDHKVIVVPAVVEEKFYHDKNPFNLGAGDVGQTGGSGEGEEGDVIGKAPIRPDGEGDDAGEGGEGDSEGHEMIIRAYELGKMLSEDFELPNIQDKGRKKSLTKHVYELTDRNKGSGQLLDTMETVQNVIKTNIALGNIEDVDGIDTSDLLISPEDYIYRLLSRERMYESEAVVFFMRDYSGSMSGSPTEVLRSQHLLIYAWLVYQYDERVKTRFLVHDQEAKEVPDFDTYYRTNTYGGTDVHTVFKFLNEIVEDENLEKDYNIYVFYGTDGEDWMDGKKTISEMEKMLGYTNRAGLTFLKNDVSSSTKVEDYLEDSGIFRKYPELLKSTSLPKQEDVAQQKIVESIKDLIS